MRALVFDLSIPRYLAARATGGRVPALHWGPLSCFNLREVPDPSPPSSSFGLLAPILSGFCGSDLALLQFKTSAAMSIYDSSPCVLGHEVLASVVEPPRGSSLREGDRVVLDPWISCAVRETPNCPRCAVDEYATCERAAIGPRKGMLAGACNELPGGFAERMLGHESQLFAVPEAMSNERAVLTEPFAVATHSVLRNAPLPQQRVLVLGGGIIALAVIWALREFCPDVEITNLTFEKYQLDMAQTLGANTLLRPIRGRDNLALMAASLGTRMLKPVLGRPQLQGGYDSVFDCVGSASSLDDSMRATRAGGTLVMVGCAGVLPQVEGSLVWSRELRIAGTLAYSYDTHAGQRARTFAITLEHLQSSRAPLESLVTHTFALDDFAQAIEANIDRRTTRSIKTVFAQ